MVHIYSLFYSYLYGIETAFLIIFFSDIGQFYSYLYGIETKNNKDIRIAKERFTRTFMEFFTRTFMELKHDLIYIPCIHIEFYSYLYGIETFELLGYPHIFAEFYSYLYGTEIQIDGMKNAYHETLVKFIHFVRGKLEL